MFKSDKRKYLNNFLKKHQNLSADEKQIVLDTIDNLSAHNSLQYREIQQAVNKLQSISMKGNLSDEGKILLKELHRQDWFYGILFNLRFFG